MRHLISMMTLAALMSVTACKNKQSPETLTQIAGTPVSIPLPRGFSAIPGLAGFNHNVYQASIVVISVPLPYRDARLDLTAEKLATEGQTLKASEPVTINGVEGLLCKIYYQAEGLNYGQWRLVLPDEQNTITVSGTFAVDQEKEMSATLKNTLLAVRLGPGRRDDSILSFAVQPAGDLKLAKILEGPAAVYTHDGRWTNASMFTYSLSCSKVPRTDTITKLPDLSASAFHRICPSCDIEQRDSLTLEGLPAHEVWGCRRDSASIRLKYLAIIFDKTECYFIVGTADDQHRNRLESFRNAVKTWQRKNERV